MAKKKYSYRGKSLEELQTMSYEELAELLPSKQRRKIRRGFTEAEEKLIEKVRNKESTKTHLREMMVLPEFVDKTIRIHNGQKFEAIKIQADMIGHRLGELVLTRKRLQHSAPGVGATRSTANISVR